MLLQPFSLKILLMARRILMKMLNKCHQGCVTMMLVTGADSWHLDICRFFRLCSILVELAPC